MNTDLHARIAEAVTRTREYADSTDDSFVLRVCDHADDVLARHRPSNRPIVWCRVAGIGHETYPCAEVRALADLWLGDGSNA